MQKINDRIQEMLKNHKIKKQYLFVLFLLSLMIIASICFSLMVPAMSMSGEMVCTKSEHIHGDECYEKVLVCTESTEGHIHTDECYETEKVLKCVLEENEEHTHSDECYEYQKVLICNIPETEAHVHTDECYEDVLICDKEEHIHSADCYAIDAISTEANNTDATVSTIEKNNTNTELTDETDGLDDEEEQLGEVTMAMPNKLQKEFAVNAEADFNLSDKAIDFADLITKIEHREVDDKIRPSNIGNEVEYYYRNVDFTINYEITRTELTSKDPNNRQIYCELSNDIVIRGVREGNVLKDDRVIGRYNISNDNKVIIVFNDNIVMEGEHIEGDIQFNADVKKIDDNNGFENVKIGNNDVEIPFEDMSIDKSNKETETDREGFIKVDYTVNVKSNCGSGNGNIIFTDGLINKNSNNDEIAIDRDSIKIIKNNLNGSSKIVATPNFTDDKNFTISNLDPLEPNESYTITYSVYMKPEAATISLNATNEATATNKKLTSSTESTFSKEVGCNISKSGSYDEKTEKLKWEVIVKNPSSLSLEGYKIIDQMLKDTSSIKIERQDNNGTWLSEEQIDRNNSSCETGTFDVSTNTFTFKEVFGKFYKLTYEIDVTQEWLEGVPSEYKEYDQRNKTYKIKNIASLNPPGENPIIKTDEGTADVKPERNEIDKYKGNVTHDENKNAIIPWTVNLKGVVGKFGNQIYTDEMTDSDNGNYHYMTVAQLRELKVYGQLDNKLLTIGADYTVIVNDIEINSNSGFDSLSDNINNFKIKFLDSDDIKSQSDIKLEYLTMGIVSDIPINGKRIYTNTATFRDKSKPATHEEQNNPPIYKIYKYDTRDPYKQSTDHNVNDIIIDDKYVLRWYIDVDPTRCTLEADGSVVLTDTLPEGVSLNENSVLYGDQKQNKDQGFTVNGQQITFTIPQSIHNGSEINVYYDVTVSDSVVPKVDNEQASFENTVRNGSYETAQTQTIKKIPLDKLTKIGPVWEDVYNGHINYTLDVNPTGNIINNGNPITIEDTLSSNKWYEAYTCSLDSLQVNIIDSDGVREEIPATEYMLSSLTKEGLNFKFVLSGLPDGKHLEIKYTFTCAYTEAGKKDIVWVNDWENFTDEQIGTISGNGGLIVGPHEIDWGIIMNNKAALKLDSETIEKNVEDKYFFAYRDRAHATTESQIYKYESGHFNIALPNAHFAIYKYNSDGEKLTVGAGFITNENGMISLNSLEEGVLYKIIETVAPTGYGKSNCSYYFAYNSLPDAEVLSAANITDTSIVQIIKKGQNINIANTKMLPATGGEGTRPYMITGIALMAGSSLMYFCFKRQKRRMK